MKTRLKSSHESMESVLICDPNLEKAKFFRSVAEARRGTNRFLLDLGFHLYKYTCKPHEIVISL
jgi:hypothetical protein